MRNECAKNAALTMMPFIGPTYHRPTYEACDCFLWRLLLATATQALGVTHPLLLWVGPVCLVFYLQVAIANLKCFSVPHACSGPYSVYVLHQNMERCKCLTVHCIGRSKCVTAVGCGCALCTRHASIQCQHQQLHKYYCTECFRATGEALLICTLLFK